MLRNKVLREEKKRRGSNGENELAKKERKRKTDVGEKCAIA